MGVYLCVYVKQVRESEGVKRERVGVSGGEREREGARGRGNERKGGPERK